MEDIFEIGSCIEILANVVYDTKWMPVSRHDKKQKTRRDLLLFGLRNIISCLWSGWLTEMKTGGKVDSTSWNGSAVEPSLTGRRGPTDTQHSAAQMTSTTSSKSTSSSAAGLNDVSSWSQEDRLQGMRHGDARRVSSL